MVVAVPPLEIMMIRNVAENLMNHANGRPEEAWETETWTDCLGDGPNRIPMSQVRALIVSLQRKGLVRVSGTGREGGVTLTEEGFSMWRGVRDARERPRVSG